MLFNSFEFLIFFPLVTLIYFLIPHRFRWMHLLLASCIFYMFFIPVYILILFFTILIDYVAGIYIEKSQGKKRKWFLVISIIANVGVLAVFKYYNFFIENVNHLFHSFSIQTHDISFLNIILPIGLSFHTFQAMSYTIEVYRGNQKAEKHIGIYALYVMFYPQLVAGPIERPQNLLHQFREKHFFNQENMMNGIRLMIWGFFKKIVIADRLAIYVNEVYGHPSDFHWLNLAIATLFFTIQIYCDFSGYSDIAIGAARTMGFNLMTNFKNPYFASNIRSFWNRWHISLSTWFRDYVYIPLGGNKVKEQRTYLNLLIVFLLSGLWHGANWTFIVWGLLHALFVIVYSFFKIHFKKIAYTNNFFLMIGALLTFAFVSFAWIFFRANTLSDALLISKNIFTFNTTFSFQKKLLSPAAIFNTTSFVISSFSIIVLFTIEKITNSNFTYFTRKPLQDIFFVTFLLVTILIFGMFTKNSFIYFQF